MKRILGLTCIFALWASAVNAGVLEVIKTVAAGAKDGGLLYGLAALVILYVFKVIPNAKIYAAVRKTATALGVTVTLGLSKWKFTAPLWNKTVEPWVVDFIDNTAGAFVQGFISGLRSDNANA